ncbi:family 43 glycosylhydrolase [Bifidobacterium bombi]|uniref:Exo-alpha-L-arabinofuranosidase II n=1 Tax=Bifidobacterium bombi DSM 19703 TaxID=1341695 RepID=A0A080N3I7_9BIFI|nr:family 43 glycosylhydrolase [Bifidobacterium bombi]KFF31561.1 exo-alpha-L-arabinofuranosidase II [Bifidobacterium bombi DSM 19703]
MAEYENPIVLQRADPWVLKDGDTYYFTSSDPRYDTIGIRSAKRIDDLQKAPEVTIWHRHDSGPMSKYIWAPELHKVSGKWYIYFAAAQTDFEASGLPTHRMYVLENADADPMSGNWTEKGRIETPIDSFSLDATTEVIDGVQYLVWAQKDPAIEGNSNLYIARMSDPWTLASEPVMLSRPEYDWECIDFLVNEGPAFLLHADKVFLTYSASGTGVPYAVGLLTASRGSDLLDPASWTKSPVPVFKTCQANGQYGPGHNSFTKSEDGQQDLMVYHARNYTHIEGDPLFDPNRHARVGVVNWKADGTPDFGVPQPDTRWTPVTVDILPPDGGDDAK